MPTVGPMTIHFALDLTGGAYNAPNNAFEDWDLALEDMEANFGMAQAVWFNNVNNPAGVEWVMAGSDQHLWFPPFSMGMLPIIQSGSFRLRSYCPNPNTVTPTSLKGNLLNTPQASFIYTPGN